MSNWWKLHGAWVAALFAGLMQVTQNVDPSFYTGLFGAHAGPFAQRWIELVAMLYAAAHAAYQRPAPAAKPQSSEGGYARVSLLTLLAAVAALTGCALLANPTFDALLQAAIQAVVSAIVAKNPTAAQILYTDAQALAQLAQGSTSVTALQQQADSVVSASSLPAGDKAAIEDIIAAVAGPGGLLAQEGQSVPDNAKPGLQLVFADIANAAQLAGNTNPPATGSRLAGAAPAVINAIDDAVNQLNGHR